MNTTEPRQPKEENRELINDLCEIIWDELKRNENRSSPNETYQLIRERLIAYFEDSGKYIPPKRR